MTAGLALTVVPSAADTLPAVETFNVDETSNNFPVEAMKGERTAVASDELLLTDATTGLVFSRTPNATGTDLSGRTGEWPWPSSLSGRSRINPIGATASGSMVDPFKQKTWGLSLVEDLDQGLSSDFTTNGPLLQLTSANDTAAGPGYYGFVDEVDELTAGRTYVIRSTMMLDHIDSDSPPALTNVPRTSPMSMRATDDNHPALTQQWSVVEQGRSDENNMQFQLINRSDGTCLDIGARRGAASWQPGTGMVCDADSQTQLWESRESPDGKAGTGLYNVGINAYAGYQARTSEAGDLVLPVVGQTWEYEWDMKNLDGVSWTWQEVKANDGYAGIPPATAFPAEDRIDFPFDLAVGDVDSVRTDYGLMMDESVAVYGADGGFEISVVDYSANQSRMLVTSQRVDVSVGQAADGGDYAPLSVNLADLDGDGFQEIVATYVDEAGAVNAVVARYSADGAARALEVVGDPVPLGFGVPTDTRFSADAAVSDFDGDGVKDVAWVGADASNGSVPTLWTVGLQLSGDDVAVQRTTATALSSSSKPLASNAGWNARVQVESGKFQDAAANSGSRQIAVTWEDADGAFVDAFALTADSDTVQSIFPDAISTPQVIESRGVSLAVGGFAFAGGGTNMLWGIAVSAVGGNGSKNHTVTLIQPDSSGEAPAVNTLSTPPNNGVSASRPGYELTAYDPDGNSVILGEPVVFNVQELVNLNLAAGQPPAHSDWLNGGFQNISRNESFTLQMGTSSSEGYENGVSQEANQSFGVTGSFDIKSTVSGGVPFFGDVTASAGLAAKLEGTWASVESGFADASSSQTKSVTQTTADDDIVNAMVQDFQVSRYPVLSSDAWDNPSLTESGCDGGCYGYWDIVIPGEPHPFSGPGKGQWYFQPSWQNGNALSYPRLDSGEVPLSDLGPYGYTDSDGNMQSVTAPLLNDEFGLGSTTTTQKLDLSGAVSAGSAESSTKGWSAGADVTAGGSAEAKVPFFADVSVEGSLSAGFNAAQSFMGSSTGSTSNTHSNSFQLNVPAVDSNRGYNFGVAYYYGTDGAPRVTYGVDLLSNNQSKEWWLTEYGQKPDPALNLYYSSILTFNARGYLGTPEWNSLSNRQELRGFEARMPESDDAATSGAVYERSPLAGDPVVFDVEVGNYSLMALDEEITVDFYAVPVDGNSIGVTGDPVSIGTSTIDALGPQEHAIVSSPEWTALAGADGGGQNWRIFVVLDEGETVDEVHGWAGNGSDTCPASSVQGEATLTDPMTGEVETLTCGQNNQGFGNLSVLPAGSKTQTAMARAGAVELPPVGAGVLTGDPTTLRLDGDSVLPEVTTGDATTVMVRVGGEESSETRRTVLVYEGDPADGNSVAAVRTSGIGEDGMSLASFQYMPDTDGLHELNAVILGGGDPANSHGLTIRMNSTPDTTDNGGGDGGDGGDDGNENGNGGSGDNGNSGGSSDSSDSAADGSLSSTGVEAIPWLLAGFGALLLGLVLVARRRFRTTSTKE